MLSAIDNDYGRNKGKNPMNIMKMMQQMGKIQENVQAAQEKLESETVEGSSGAGMISVQMNGKMRVTAINISDEAMQSGDASLLEDLIVAALEDARAKAKEMMEQHMQEATGGLNLPGGLNPFG